MLTEEEKELLRSIVRDLEVTEPFSFNIKDSQGRLVEIEGSNEFFSAPQIRSFYTIYATFLVGLYRQLNAANERIAELEARVGKTETFTKRVVAPIRVDDI